MSAAGGAGRPRRLLDPAELRAMAAIALPSVLVQVGVMSLGVADTMMAGRISAEAVAGAALGNLYLFVLSVFGFGTLLGLDPIIAQALGAGDSGAARRGVQRGLVIASVLAVVISLLLLPAEAVLRSARQPADVVPIAGAFARASIPGVPALLAWNVVRQSLQAQHAMRPIVVSVVLGNLANLALNWALMFGNLGAPRLGAVGSAWSSSITRWIMLAVIVGAGWPTLRPLLRPLVGDAFSPRALWRTARVGVPIGVQQTVEVATFAGATVLMGLFGTLPLAGHEIALNLASLTFMVPLGVGAAAAVLVGRAVGAGDADEARLHAASSITIGALFMCASAALFLLAPERLARLYTDDPRVAAAAVLFLPVAGLFQVFDGVQAVAAGVLRGVGDTRAPLLANLAGFWLVGIPVGVVLAFRTALGPVGLWWGLAGGLAAVSALLLARVRWRLARDLTRLNVDGAAPGPRG